jgi:hypothetical protein
MEPVFGNPSLLRKPLVTLLGGLVMTGPFNFWVASFDAQRPKTTCFCVSHGGLVATLFDVNGSILGVSGSGKACGRTDGVAPAFAIGFITVGKAALRQRSPACHMAEEAHQLG